MHEKDREDSKWRQQKKEQQSVEINKKSKLREYKRRSSVGLQWYVKESWGVEEDKMKRWFAPEDVCVKENIEWSDEFVQVILMNQG